MTFLSRREFLAGLAAASISGCKRLRGPLQFGQLDAIDGAIPRLAYTLGYFAKEGVDVVTTLDASGAAIVQQMTAITGALDLGVMGLPPLCSMIGQYQVRPAVIATVSGSDYTCQLRCEWRRSTPKDRRTPLAGLGSLRSHRFSVDTNIHE